MTSSTKTRILIVGMADSIHTARWVEHLSGSGWDVHLFPTLDVGQVHPRLRDVTVYHSFYRSGRSPSTVRSRGVPIPAEKIAYALRLVRKDLTPRHRVRQLRRLIEKLRPSVVHSLELQSAGYLTHEAKREMRDSFPTWIATNWGSDISLFGQLNSHVERIRNVLSSCDFYSCECQRDVALARRFGFRGEVLPVFPNSGGFNLDEIARLRRPGKTSARRTIALKGYQGWAGRALVGLRALERCSDALAGYTIVITSVPDLSKTVVGTSDVEIAAELFTKRTGVPTRIIHMHAPHESILRLHGESRTSIGLSISDAISTSLLEAMAMGAFPIQSSTACADEWIRDGETGLLVPPEDPDVIERALRRALTDDALVDRAADANAVVVRERLDERVLRTKVIDFYHRVLNRHPA